MLNKNSMKSKSVAFGDKIEENLVRRVLIHLVTDEAKPARHAKNVGVDGNRVSSEAETHDDARRFRADAWQCEEPVNRVLSRHGSQVFEAVGARPFVDDLERVDYALGLLVGESGLSYRVYDSVWTRFDNHFPGRKLGPEMGESRKTSGVGRVLAQDAGYQLIHRFKSADESGFSIHRFEPRQSLTNVKFWPGCPGTTSRSHVSRIH